ncbi:MAG: NAD(P)-dependent oxidoreductase [Elusimicrobia bacterium]|nr:NAD(P)-dependent oxidoreductase [Elusimicrobiota bacterium]
MKLLITGGKGFVARSLAEQLGKGYEIAAPGRQELDLLDADRVADYLKAGKFDAVLHCATYDAAPKTSTKDPAKVLEYNLRMFFNLARSGADFGRLVYFGSGAEFGREHWKPRMSEDFFDEHVPPDPYGFSKYLMTRHALSASNIYNLRLFGVYGKYDDWRYRFIPNICARLALDLPLLIARNRTMDLLYIDDLVKMTDWLLRAEKPRKVYNACSGEARDYVSIAGDILAVSGKRAVLSVKTPGLGREYSGDNSLLLGDSGLRPVPMKKALKELYDWYAANPGYLDREQILSYPL